MIMIVNWWLHIDATNNWAYILLINVDIHDGAWMIDPTVINYPQKMNKYQEKTDSYFIEEKYYNNTQ